MYLWSFFFFFFPRLYEINCIASSVSHTQGSQRGVVSTRVSGPYINRTMYDFYEISTAVTAGEYCIQSR